MRSATSRSGSRDTARRPRRGDHGDGTPVYQDRLVITLDKFPEGWLVTGARES